MAINFPNSPIVDTVHTAAGVSWKWDGTTWQASAVGGSSGGGGATVTVSDSAPTNAVLGDLWWKSDEGQLKVYYNDTNSFQWVDASTVQQGNVSYLYSSVASFPGPSVSESELAYDDSDGSLYYSNGVSWTSQRLVTTNSTTSSDFATLLGNFERTYSLTTANHSGGSAAQNAKRKLIKLADNKGNLDEFTLAVEGNTLAISKSTNTWGNDEITITGQEYMLGVIADTPPADTILRLSGIGAYPSTQDITIQGLDGIQVERVDGQTLGIRAASIGVTQYTDDMAKDATWNAFQNGTHSNITFTYDQTNRVINAVATGTGGGGTAVLYDLTGNSTTSNQAIVQLVPSTGATDEIEFAGAGGTTVAWDSVNAKVTIDSDVYTLAANAAASGSGDLALTGTEFQFTPPDLSGYLTSIPIADASTLGGIKVGQNLTVTADGTLSAVQGNYTLPTAGQGAGGTLGGVKVDGTTVTIDGNGVITAQGGTTVPSIDDLTGTTSSLAPDTAGELNITGYKGYVLYKITSSHESWIKVYVDDASRDADLTRSEGQDPAPGSGVLAEVRTAGPSESVLITPGVMGFNNDDPRTDQIYVSVTNRSNAAAAVTITLTALKIGE
tara:strand:- start:5064 stop:6896 length:1833 start_codon:yes stop_codon:yes gene_type:complete